MEASDTVSIWAETDRQMQAQIPGEPGGVSTYFLLRIEDAGDEPHHQK